jgi:hypothetical protein
MHGTKQPPAGLFTACNKNVPQVTSGYNTVNSLLTTAEWMVASSHPVDSSVFQDLKMCIHIRSRVAKSVFGGRDATQKYFLDVLVYC